MTSHSVTAGTDTVTPDLGRYSLELLPLDICPSEVVARAARVERNQGFALCGNLIDGYLALEAGLVVDFYFPVVLRIERSQVGAGDSLTSHVGVVVGVEVRIVVPSAALTVVLEGETLLVVIVGEAEVGSDEEFGLALVDGDFVFVAGDGIFGGTLARERAAFLGVGGRDEVAVRVVADGNGERAGTRGGHGAVEDAGHGSLVARVAVQIPVVLRTPHNVFLRDALEALATEAVPTWRCGDVGDALVVVFLELGDAVDVEDFRGVFWEADLDPGGSAIIFGTGFAQSGVYLEHVDALGVVQLTDRHTVPGSCGGSLSIDSLAERGRSEQTI